MVKLKKLSIILVLVLVMGAFAGCGSKGIDKISEGLSNYKITANYDDTAKTVTAIQKVDYINNFDVELNTVCFNIYANAYREGGMSPIDSRDNASAFPNGKSFGKIDIKGVSIDGKSVEFKILGMDANLLSVPLLEELMPSDRVTIVMEYVVTLANVRHRLGYFEKTVNLGNWFPIAAMYSGGAFVDYPYYSNGDPFFSSVANFDVTLTAPSKYKIACTGESTSTVTEDIITSVSSAKAVRNWAAVIGEFECIEGEESGVKISYYYYNDENSAAHLKAAADSIKTFNEAFGAYPYKTLSVVKTAFLQGGMEYPNLVYISDEVIGEIFKEVIIHEVAHQWWYGVVGNNEVENAWLDEGLAEFSTSYFYEKNPEYNVKYDDRIADALGAFVLYCDLYKQNLNTKMNRPVNEFVSGLEYTYMTYVKGQIMFDTLRTSIGDKAMFDGLKLYYKDNYLKEATPVHLISAFEKTSKKDLMSFFDSWLEGKVLLYGGFNK